MGRKKGTCLCECGGEVIGSNHTMVESNNEKVVSCKRCYKVWDADYAFAAQPNRGIIELDINDQYSFVRQKKKGSFL